MYSALVWVYWWGRAGILRFFCRLACCFLLSGVHLPSHAVRSLSFFQPLLGLLPLLLEGTLK